MRERGLSAEDIRKLKLILSSRRGPNTNREVLKQKKPSESRCPECGARITETNTLGEVGHLPRCPRRKDRYRGRTGNMRPSPPNKKTELVADGGKR